MDIRDIPCTAKTLDTKHWENECLEEKDDDDMVSDLLRGVKRESLS